MRRVFPIPLLHLLDEHSLLIRTPHSLALPHLEPVHLLGHDVVFRNDARRSLVDAAHSLQLSNGGAGAAVVLARGRCLRATALAAALADFLVERIGA